MNNTQRRALAEWLDAAGFAVTAAAVDAIIEDIRADLADGQDRDAPESLDDVEDVDSYLRDSVNALYSRTGDRATADFYRVAVQDAVALALEGRLAFTEDERYWRDSSDAQDQHGSR